MYILIRVAFEIRGIVQMSLFYLVNLLKRRLLKAVMTY
jgi:hypothetical protein